MGSEMCIRDRLTNWFEVAQWTSDPSAAQTMEVVRRLFSSLGVPMILSMDNGPQFRALAFRTMLDNWGVRPRYSTPYYPASNGHAESAVKSAKKLLATTSPDIKSEVFLKGLLAHRNTPRQERGSPAQLLYGRDLRSHVPTHHSHFDRKWQVTSKEHSTKRAIAIKKNHDKGAVDLAPLRVGDAVVLRNRISKLWNEPGIIVEVLPHLSLIHI